MSRIAKHPIKIPAGIEARLSGRKLSLKGKKGELTLNISNDITAELKDGAVSLKMGTQSRHAKNMWGTTSSLIRGMIKGVTEGYHKKLLIEGVGFRAALQGKDLVLQIGFSH